MSTLILKEFVILKRSVIHNLLYIAFLFIIFGLTGGPFRDSAYIMGSAATTFMFIQMGCAVDEKNHSEVVLNSLPLRRSALVLAKYLSAILFTLLMLVYMSLVGAFLSRLPQLRLNPVQTRDWIIALSTASVLVALYCPLFFKYGYLRSKWLSSMVFYPFFFGPTLLQSFAESHPEHPAVRLAMNFFTAAPPWQTGLLFLGLALCILLLSQTLSTRLYRQREF